ncbi:plasmid mobilization relaxosome protein MobC [Bengtsoniella intestinalis]|uniref:plasmid mobilization relaxosome protein MobC n=1 Tax=Bengtsoniella intestinalis TaxID=3073143 RepID=UPI00391EE4B0
MCEISGLTPSQLVRQLLHGTTIRQKPSAQLRELFVEVNRIGNNVNQIARKVNGNIGSKEDVAELQLLLHTIVKLVDGLGR